MSEAYVIDVHVPKEVTDDCILESKGKLRYIAQRLVPCGPL